MSRRKTQVVRITGQRPGECPACEGLGYTKETFTEMRQRPGAGKLYTHKQGSGCPDCYGTGRQIVTGHRVAA